MIKIYSIIDALESLYPRSSWSLGGDFTYEDLEWRDEDIDKPSKEEVETELTRLRSLEPLRSLREERDRLIAETDWWVLPDRTPTDEQLAYRQALRDLPDNTEDPANPVWPTKPE